MLFMLTSHSRWLPSSIKVSYGSIAYDLNVKMDRKGVFFDDNCSLDLHFIQTEVTEIGQPQFLVCFGLYLRSLVMQLYMSC